MSETPQVAPPPAPPTQHERDENRARFETEVEFVQCLANPFYLQHLAQQGLFDSEPFLNYLNYLLYFRSPRYSRFLQYPQCLHHLSLLTAPGETGKSFRQAFKDQPLMAQELAGKQIAHWAGWRERDAMSGTNEQGGGGAKEDGK
ncbi:mediator complex subunit SOH1 [Sporobolomyces salmoneus]|uniref:mediator complex subunit SOH1 n=1 Tax=Sporobolomyces salmoneus TaxID=183962 RepID=UPI00317D4D8C